MSCVASPLHEKYSNRKISSKLWSGIRGMEIELNHWFDGLTRCMYGMDSVFVATVFFGKNSQYTFVENFFYVPAEIEKNQCCSLVVWHFSSLLLETWACVRFNKWSDNLLFVYCFIWYFVSVCVVGCVNLSNWKEKSSEAISFIFNSLAVDTRYFIWK